MSPGKVAFATLISTLCVVSAAQASTIRVPADQQTIQAGIQAAVNGDTVLVSPGVYPERLNFLGKAITVASEQGAQSTIIDGGQNGSVVVFASGEGRQAVLRGFTIRNGKAITSPYRGGGVRIENSSPTVTGNIITNNVAADSGGGVLSSFGSPLIQGNTIVNNGQAPGFSGGVGGGGVAIVGASSAQLLNNAISGNTWANASGGGVSLFAAGTPTIQNNLITNNSAGSQGGGISMVNQSDAQIVQNIIAGNSAGSGGGVYWLVPSGARGPYLVNNTVAGNYASQGSAIFADGFDGQSLLINNLLIASSGQNAVMCGSFNSASVPSFQFNDVMALSGAAYSGACTDQTGINGNISVDPIFRNPAAADYHLVSGSPAIDAGTSNQAPPLDLDNVGRPADGDSDGVAKFDIGAYETPTLDSVPPTSSATIAPAPNSKGWNKEALLVKLNATDSPGSGVQSIRYWIEGAQTTPVTIGGSSVDVAITSEGQSTIYHSATDVSGNVEATKSVTVKLDKTAPLISGMPVNCTLSPAKHQLMLAAVVSAADAVSTIDSLSISATSNEPDSGVGGGDLPGDIVISGGSVQLRAERSPSGKGRTYTIVAVATDLAGNSKTATATCTVPK